ncbi:MAG: SLC13 family permease [Bacteroides sp.]|nr:SLC13 family permease [Bacteroides sp.]
MTFEIAFVLLALLGMVVALILDKMRPGMILFTVVVLFLCAGILSPKEMLEGFSNKGMITVAMLFLVSEGIRQSGALGQVIKKLLPQGKTTVFKAQLRLLPTIAFISAFLNNTPVVVIFAPIIKRWAESVKLPATKFLIPLSYVTILGGICTLIGTSTNLVVHGMILEAGHRGFTMFELGKVGVFIALAGIIYLLLFSSKLLPDVRKSKVKDEDEQDAQEGQTDLHPVEVVLGARFPGINKRLGDFNFKRHYGAEVKEIRRSGQSFTQQLDDEYLREGDTLVLMADDSFVQAWGESSVFMLLANGKDTEPVPRKRKRWLALTLLILMIAGATVGELPVVKEMFPGVQLDMFFFVSVTTIIMAWTKIFPARKYTKYISWDILITIACAFAISKAMVNSGVADLVARYIIGMTEHYGPQVLLAAVFVITNLFTELITNNAAAALAFPLALSISQQLGVDPMPFFVVICMAASASFSTPIGYQTNLIVQGIGNYKFTDFVRIGLPMNLITFLISIFLIPLIWPF